MLTILAVITLLLVCFAARASSATAKHSPRFEVAAALNRGLAGTPMAGTGFTLEAAGWRHGIHPALIAAIAGTESSFGAAACYSNRFNAFGLASCGTSWRVPTFASWRDAYEFMGRFLRSRWPSARTPWDFHGYAACSSCWGSKTAYWMQRLGFPAIARYGR